MLHGMSTKEKKKRKKSNRGLSYDHGLDYASSSDNNKYSYTYNYNMSGCGTSWVSSIISGNFLKSEITSASSWLRDLCRRVFYGAWVES